MKKGILIGGGAGLLFLGGTVFFFAKKSGTQTYMNPVMIEKLAADAVGTSTKETTVSLEERKEESAKGAPEKLDVSIQEKTEPTPAPTPVLTPMPTPTPAKEKENNLNIIDRLVHFGFSSPKQARSIDTIVLHSSYNALGGDRFDIDKLVKEYETYNVSAHYAIDRVGAIYRLVKDEDVAFHAGASKMPDGRMGVNDFSIGIELMNTEESQYTNAQYDAVNALITLLETKHRIRSIVGHSDIAPGRKTDPWNFDWKRIDL